MFSSFFIRRPIFASVLSIVIVLAGIFGMRALPIEQYPQIVPPSVVGSGLIDTDRTMRGLGLYRQASESVNALSPGTRTQLEAYAAGVNAWLKDDDQQYGLELTLLKLLSGGRYRPEPWRPADSLVWGKLMALGLDGNAKSFVPDSDDVLYHTALVQPRSEEHTSELQSR